MTTKTWNTAEIAEKLTTTVNQWAWVRRAIIALGDWSVLSTCIGIHDPENGNKKYMEWSDDQNRLVEWAKVIKRQNNVSFGTLEQAQKILVKYPELVATLTKIANGKKLYPTHLELGGSWGFHGYRRGVFTVAYRKDMKIMEDDWTGGPSPMSVSRRVIENDKTLNLRGLTVDELFENYDVIEVDRRTN